MKIKSFNIDKENNIVEYNQVLKLSKRDAILLINTLDRPAKTNKKLKEAFYNYEGKKRKK